MKTQIALALAFAFGGSALADTPKTPAPDAKKDAPKAPDAKKTPPAPPAELAAMAKDMAGNWKCTGKGAMDPADMTKMTDMKGTYAAKLDLDKWWIRGDFTATVTGMPGTMKGTMYTTFDAASKKWTRVMMDNMGGFESTTSSGGTGKIVWEGDSHGMGMTMKTRTTEELTAKEMKISSEASMDGKKWMAAFEMSCKK
jgi:hypothetical protein